MELAIRTGVAPDVWADQGERAIVTALELLATDQTPAAAAETRQMKG